MLNPRTTPLRLHIYVVFVFAALLLAVPAQGQSKRSFYKSGLQAFKQKEYNTALLNFGEVLQRDPDHIDALWYYAETCRELWMLSTAKKTYQTLKGFSEALTCYPQLCYHLAVIEQMEGNYSEALSALGCFDAVATDSIWVAKAKRIRRACTWAMEQQSSANSPKVLHLDKKINSPYSDFGPTMRGDTLFFSSYRFERLSKKNPKSRQSRLMMSVANRAAKEPLRGIPAGDSLHVAHAAFSPDGQWLIFNFCKNVNAFDIRCELWMATRDVRGKWTAPQRLPAPVNMSGYTQTQPSIAYDGASRQMRLWFSSDRPGGKGGLDIWSVPLDSTWFCPCNLPLSYKKPRPLPQFAAPEPLAAINTSFNDITPYFHTATQTLYFSSDGYPGFGAYDIFSATRQGSAFEAPLNIGNTINSPLNDLYFQLKTDGQSGYFSSNRTGAIYLDATNKACCNDLFQVVLPAPKPAITDDTIPTLVTKAPPLVVPPTLPLPEQPKPVLRDFVGLPLYFDNDEPDKRTTRTTTKQSYETTVLNYLERQDEYLVQFSNSLPDAEQVDAENAVNDFFEEEVRAGYERLEQLCLLLEERLQTGEQVEVLIKGFTSPRAQSDYNLNLGKRRISSVRNHLMLWNDGSLNAYFNSGALRVSETSFGETTSRRDVSDNINDVRNSVYSPDAARERRVEIVEIRVK
jgi:outer membrane protein OmpA-like peptidoglycan-associated protein